MYNKHRWWKDGCAHLSIHFFSALSSKHNVLEDQRCKAEAQWSEEQFIRTSLCMYCIRTLHVKYEGRTGKSEATAETSGEIRAGC